MSVGCGCVLDVYNVMAMATPLQACFTEHVKLGHDIAGPTAEICTKGGIRKQIFLAESVANWLGESQYIGGFRIHIESNLRSRQAK